LFISAIRISITRCCQAGKAITKRRQSIKIARRRIAAIKTGLTIIINCSKATLFV